MGHTPSWLTELPVAHRGLHNAVTPENSLSSVKAAAAAGYAIELDVQLTLDEDMAVFHDTNLKRMTGKRREVQFSTYQAMRKYPFIGTEERIPSLYHVLREVEGAVPLLIEIKPGRATKLRAQRTARYLEDYRGPVAVQSFDPRIVAWFKKNTSLPTGQIMGRYRDPFLAKPLRRHLERMWLAQATVPPDFVAFDLKKLSPETSDLLRSRLPLLTWTVKSEGKLEQARVLADNVIFENIKPEIA